MFRRRRRTVISGCCFAEDGKEIYKDLKRTCTAIVQLIKPFVWWRSRCRRRRGLLKLPKYREKNERFRTESAKSVICIMLHNNKYGNDIKIVFMKNSVLDISVLQKYICAIQINIFCCRSVENAKFS